MELSPGDIFDAETDTVPENVTADLQRQNYSPRQCELVTDSGDLVTSAPEEFYSLKLAGDHAYLVKEYNKAVGLYEKYIRYSTAETGGNLRDVLESLVRCHLALNDFDKADAVCKKLVKVGHVQNVLLLRLEIAKRRNDWSTETVSLLCQLIELHPWLDRLWLELANWFRSRKEAAKEFWCLERATQTENSSNISDIQKLKEENPLDSESKNVIAGKISESLRVPKQTRNVDPDSDDFVDLGSSLKTKERDQTMDNVRASEEECEQVIKRFENRWFFT